MRKTLQVTVILVFIFSSTKAQKVQESKLFADFKADKSTSTLPDFSFAGYKSGEASIPNVEHKIFNVTDFGAKANDQESDRKAIELAIAAAKENGSGVVFFPPGRFLVNEDNDPKTSIVIDASNVVLRGSGSGSGGTELYMKNSLLPANPNQMWTTPKMFVMGNSSKNTSIGKITENAAIGQFTINVSSGSSLNAGDWILLSMNSNDVELIKDDVANQPVDTVWAITKSGVRLRVFHQVKSVSGNKVTLVQPIAYAVNPKHNWVVFKVTAAREEVGVEKIAFVGNWHEPFVHHKSWIHDSGWSMLSFNNTFNSWIKDCRFTDINVGAVINSGANLSVLNCEVTGNPGHEAISNTGGTNVLIAHVKDKASMWHSFGVANASMNTVVLHADYPSTTSFEAHASQPRNTLLDNVKGGLLYNRGGGAKENTPNHLKNLVIWNYKQTNEAQVNFEFWPSNKWYWRIPNPIIAGFSGGTTFNPQQIHPQSELTNQVFPNSLYEAQLILRLGKIPTWLKDIKTK